MRKFNQEELEHRVKQFEAQFNDSNVNLIIMAETTGSKKTMTIIKPHSEVKEDQQISEMWGRSARLIKKILALYSFSLSDLLSDLVGKLYTDCDDCENKDICNDED